MVICEEKEGAEMSAIFKSLVLCDEGERHANVPKSSYNASGMS